MTMVSVRRDDSIMIREVDGEIVALDVATNQVHQFNATASFVWRQCVQGADTKDIAARLAEAFEVDDDIALRDTLSLVAALCRLGLLEPLR